MDNCHFSNRSLHFILIETLKYFKKFESTAHFEFQLVSLPLFHWLR